MQELSGGMHGKGFGRRRRAFSCDRRAGSASFDVVVTIVNKQKNNIDER